jgi:hypothetical protein
MASSEMLRRVALVETNVSEEPSSSFIRGTRIGELGTTLAVTSNRRTLRAYHSPELKKSRNLEILSVIYHCQKHFGSTIQCVQSGVQRHAFANIH